MPECLIFDLFGTLVEYEAGRTLQDFSRSYKKATELGCAIGYADYVQVWDSAFLKMEHATAPDNSEFHLREVCDLVVVELRLDATGTAKEQLTRQYMEDWSALLSPVPGATGLLKRLSKHYRLALISNTHYPPMVHAVLEAMSLTELFEVVTLSAEVGWAKPHPLIFELTLEKLGLSANQTIYVGDSYERDYKGARGVGMDCQLIGRHARVPRDHQLRNILDLAINFETARK